jgi:PAS domain S-box-containing protein
MSVETQDPTSHATPGRLVREQIVREAARISAELTRQGISTDPFASAVRATRMPMIITNPRIPDNPVVFANEAFCRLTGYAREEIIGRNCRFLQGPDTDRGTVVEIRDAIREERACQVRILNYTKLGAPFWNLFHMAPIFASDGRVMHYVGVQTPIAPDLASQTLPSQLPEPAHSPTTPEESPVVMRLNGGGRSLNLQCRNFFTLATAKSWKALFAFQNSWLWRIGLAI